MSLSTEIDPAYETKEVCSFFVSQARSISGIQPILNVSYPLSICYFSATEEAKVLIEDSLVSSWRVDYIKSKSAKEISDLFTLVIIEFASIKNR